MRERARPRDWRCEQARTTTINREYVPADSMSAAAKKGIRHFPSAALLLRYLNQGWRGRGLKADCDLRISPLVPARPPTTFDFASRSGHGGLQHASPGAATHECVLTTAHNDVVACNAPLRFAPHGVGLDCCHDQAVLLGQSGEVGDRMRIPERRLEHEITIVDSLHRKAEQPVAAQSAPHACKDPGEIADIDEHIR